MSSSFRHRDDVTRTEGVRRVKLTDAEHDLLRKAPNAASSGM